MTKKHLLSPEQDTAANPAENVWVQANAGTGKTSVLVQRLLRILFRTPDCGTSGILCLTYTNAGAGEMRNRILAALRKWAMLSDDEIRDMLYGVSINTPPTTQDILHAREIFFTYIDNPDILKIKTIHGFCEEILHRFPIEAGISPTWSLISGAPQSVLLQDAFNRMINSPTSNPLLLSAFSHIVNRVSEHYIDELLEILSAQYKNFFQVEDFIKYRQYFIDTTKNFLNINNAPNADFDPKKLQKIIDIATESQKSKKKPVQYLDNIINKTKQYIDTTIDFEEYKTAYLKQDGNPSAAISKLEFLSDELSRVFNLNQYNINKSVFEDTVALFDLSAAFAQEYKALKQENNLLDFEDLILYTRKLFSDGATMGWVLSQLDLSLSHILVDEAQDTSPLQWDILRMLSGDFFTDGSTSDTARSIFVVGDSKQSIYGFQGADPTAFIHSRQDIAAQIQQNLRTIKEIPLTQSFRSTAPILNTVDTFFNNPSVISITGFANNPHKCFRINDTGAVEIHKLTSKQIDNCDRKTYISDIASKIQNLINSGKYAAKDIMILVQQRNPFAPMLVTELKHRNISVAGSDRIILPEFSSVRDMLNLVRWCLNRADDYSLCCALKSPLFALKEEEIFNLCNTRNNINTTRKQQDSTIIPTTIFDVLESSHPDIHKILSDIQNHADTMAPYSFFAYLLNTYNAREKFIAALGSQVIDPLDEFMTICLSYERTQSGTLHHFLKWFITGGSEIKRDMNTSDGVRIVTVHGSKGLEAPVVFLIDTVRTPKSDKIIPITSFEKPIWIWTPNKQNTEIIANIAQKHKDTQIAEYYRLLYVAMTRARDELYIYGFTPNQNADEYAWHTQLWNVLSGNNSEQEYIRISNE